jgi:hypothetical protein
LIHLGYLQPVRKHLYSTQNIKKIYRANSNVHKAGTAIAAVKKAIVLFKYVPQEKIP